MRPALVMAIIILAALFVSSTQISVPTAPLDDHGWCGPYPHQLVSYNVQLQAPKNSAWGTAKTLVPTVPGNGLVITNVAIVPGKSSATNRPLDLRILANTTEQKAVLRIANTSSSGNRIMKLGNGIPIRKGVPLTVQGRLIGLISDHSITVTITGYTW